MADDRSLSSVSAATSAAASDPVSSQPPPSSTRSSPSSPGQPATIDPNTPFGSEALEHALKQACGDRLSEISWFRTDWQRGGALTGYASFKDDHGVAQPAVVKMPVPPIERRWLSLLQDAPDVVPRLYAHGESLGSFDLAWVVMERLPHGPIGIQWGGAGIDLLIEALARFNHASREIPVNGDAPVRKRDYRAIRESAREHIHRHGVAHEQRWNKALKQAQRKMDEWLSIWSNRPTDLWCHGDVHLGNAMTRAAPPQGPALLLDFAEVHCGHWVEDAVYLEHLYWSRRDKLEGRKICRQIAKQRKALGLHVEEDWPQLAATYRALLAMSTPAQLRHEGDPQHVEAALEVLERQAG